MGLEGERITVPVRVMAVVYLKFKSYRNLNCGSQSDISGQLISISS